VHCSKCSKASAHQATRLHSCTRPMKTKQNRSAHPWTFQITFSVAVISLSVALLTLVAAPQIQQKRAASGGALQSAHHRVAVSESSTAPKRKTLQKSAPVRIGGST